MNDDTDIVVAGGNARWREIKRRVSFPVGRDCSKALVTVAVIPNVIDANPADVGGVGDIGDLCGERDRVVHLDDVGRAFGFDHHLRDDATQR